MLTQQPGPLEHGGRLRPQRPEPEVDVRSILGLQRVAGNATVTQLIATRPDVPVQRRDLALKEKQAPLTGPDVVDLQAKLKRIGVATREGEEIVVLQTGRYDKRTARVVRAFQRSRGLKETGIVTDELRKVIDAPTTLVDKTWKEKIAGDEYGMTSKFDYQVTDTQIHVTVKLALKPKTRFDVAPHRDRWFAAIRKQWNVFKVVDKAGGRSRDIVFQPIAVSSGAHNEVDVVNGTGTHDAGTFYTRYPNGQRHNELGIAHEFGHMLALPDEYEQTHDDYRKTVGEDPFPAVGGLRAAAGAVAVATKIKEALALASKADRASTLTTLYADKNVTEGAVAMKIADAYKLATGRQLVDDLFSKLEEADRGALIAPFLATAGGLMGSRYKSMKAPGSKDSGGHEHPLAPRHMAQFVAAAKAALGGTWEATYR